MLPWLQLIQMDHLIILRTFFMISQDLTELYWASHIKSRHSQNVISSGKVFVVLYDSFKNLGGLYISADSGKIATGNELDRVVDCYNQIRIRENKSVVHTEHYKSNSGQRMWLAKTRDFWTNDAKIDKNGLIVRDFRLKVKRSAIL